MKFILLIIVMIAGIVLWRALGARQGQNGTKSKSSSAKADPAIYLELRGLALQNSPAPPDAATKPTAPLAVIMDWGITEGTALVAAFSDGTSGNDLPS
jgi:hypothetical protein